jgi:lipopolysaccharide heptosyltransferase II
VTPGWNAARRVLCVRLDALGDILMTTPAIRALKDSAPGRRVTLLTSPSGTAVAPFVPEIDDVIAYESPWMKASASRRGGADDRAMIDRLRAGRYDAAVIFTVYSQNPLPSALLCYLADVPLRLAHCRENPYHLLTDWVREREPRETVRHEVQRQLDLVSAVGCRTRDPRMSLRIDGRARHKVRALLRRAGVSPALPFVVIHPGASAPSRRYPAEHFAEAARLIVTDLCCPVVFTGSSAEAPLVDSIRAAMGVPSHSFAGLLTLAQLAALIGLAPLLVSNNTGPVHVAAALGTAVVDLYALTNPQHTPWMVPNRVLFHDVPCRYCYKSVCPEGHQDCLRLVEPAAVLEAARELLNGHAAAEMACLPPLMEKPPGLPAPIEAEGGLA